VYHDARRWCSLHGPLTAHLHIECCCLIVWFCARCVRATHLCLCVHAVCRRHCLQRGALTRDVAPLADLVAMSGESAEVRCPWNRGGGDPQRKCGGWEGNVPTVICEACDSLRTTWLTRLLSEEHEGFSRRQLLGILNRHKSYAACRQIIRIMHQHRAADKDISEEEAAAIFARSAHFQTPRVQAESTMLPARPANNPSCAWFLTLTDGKY
jgi:hypothetical protein